MHFSTHLSAQVTIVDNLIILNDLVIARIITVDIFLRLLHPLTGTTISTSPLSTYTDAGHCMFLHTRHQSFLRPYQTISSAGAETHHP